MPVLILQRLFGEALFDLVYFPVWWYSGGLVYASGRCLAWLKFGNSTLAPGLWLKNLFVPMFGQTDWQGKIISFFMRGVQIIARTVVLILWALACVLLWLLWLLLPAIAVYGLIRALTPGA